MKTIAVLIASSLFALSANATVVDFQDVPSGTCAFNTTGTLTSQGFDFTGNPIDSALFVCDPGANQHNTTAALINANSQSILTMSQNGGGVFSLESFFAGGRTEDFAPDLAVTMYSVATGIDILGNLFGGGTVSYSVVLDSIAPYDWSQYFLPASFNNLTSVVFTAQGSGPTPEFLIDDINVSVPEPASIALLGIGLVGVGFSRRKRTS